MFQTKVVEKIKAHILCSIALVRKSCHLRNNVEKYDGARQVIDGDTQQSLPLTSVIGKNQGGKNFEINILITIVNVLQWPLSDSLESPVKILRALL